MVLLLIQVAIGFAIFVAGLAVIVGMCKSAARGDEDLEEERLAKVYDFPGNWDKPERAA
jgi:hypothetical protein